MGGLRKEAPSGVRPEREPMLPLHLRHLRKSLRLATDQRDRVFWALSLCRWQMVKRCGDFLRGKFRPTGCAWNPRWETHRGRVVFDRAGAKKIRMTISFAPNKDDSTGEKKLRGSVLLYLTPGSLSCAAAVLEMLEGSPAAPRRCARPRRRRNC